MIKVVDDDALDRLGSDLLQSLYQLTAHPTNN